MCVSQKAVRFSISLVVYNSEPFLLEQTITSLHNAVLKAKQQGYLDGYHLTVVNNYQVNNQRNIDALLKKVWGNDAQVLSPMQNLGYGLGHNLAISSYCGDFHLVINPDVVVDIDGICQAIDYLQNNPQVGLVTPHSQRINGEKEYLCKQYPSVLVLLLRGFGSEFMKKQFQGSLDKYEMREKQEQPTNDVLLTSGCFMFFRKEALESVKGFSDQLFLYFEDFDLSLRLRKQWRISYLPQVKIIHYGGSSASKGVKHILLFLRSAVTFFNQHGWKIW